MEFEIGGKKFIFEDRFTGRELMKFMQKKNPVQYEQIDDSLDFLASACRNPNAKEEFLDLNLPDFTVLIESLSKKYDLDKIPHFLEKK